MNFKATLISLAALSLLTAGTVSALSADKVVSKKKQTQLGLYLDASEAYKKISEQADKILFVDVRTRAEVNFLGTPKNIDANIPYMTMNEWYAWNEKKKSFKLDVNSKFVSTLSQRLAEKGLSKDATIIVMCRSGSRSAKAANLLAKNGFKNVYSIVDGYEGDKSKSADSKGQRVVNGWKNAGLPWTYKLDKNKMYMTEAE